MSELTGRERSAIAAVARRFESPWKKGGRHADAYFKIDREKVPVDVATLKPHTHRKGFAEGARLRFDRVATTVSQQLQAALRTIVPRGTTALVTISGPTQLRSKTVRALKRGIRTLLRPGSPERDRGYMIHGNCVQIRLLSNRSVKAPRVIGLVHDSDTDPRVVLNLTEDLLELLRAEVEKRVAPRAENRWLVVASAGDASYLEAYRHICSQFGSAQKLKKILVAFPDGRVEMLTDRLPVVIPPRSVFRLVRGDERTPEWKAQVGRVFRVGYYGRQDGLDCVWLVNDQAEYEQTSDREFLLRYFEPVMISRETDLFGDSRPKLKSIGPSRDAKGGGRTKKSDRDESRN